ncbi:Na(+)-linked D-alanine glycine permease [hydrothermal vent metagenome]|uniref:Na(+)-linked D-alanine glycine permease n=1 Tax=hydrothermal vent metagenome TaxID=652676 RepID=A0A3B0ZC42_9ZZZZ
MRQRAFLIAFILSVFCGYALTLFAADDKSASESSIMSVDSTAKTVIPSSEGSDSKLVPVENKLTMEPEKNPTVKQAEPAVKEKPDTDPEFTDQEVKKRADAERKARADKKAAAEAKSLATVIAEQKGAVSKVEAAYCPTGNTADAALKAKLDGYFKRINCYLNNIIFFDLALGQLKDSQNNVIKIPFLIFWLILGAVYLTLRMGFINFRVFRHAIRIIRGKYSKKDDVGEVSHFQALTTALSATVGLGNIAGVAIAIGIGGPGATFWMILAGLLGMTTKFAEATAAQMYREIRPDGKVMGGAMEYLSRGFKEAGMAKIGKVLAIMFAIFCIGASLGGGSAFQVNQSMGVMQGTVQNFFPAVTDKVFSEYSWVYGVIMAAFVAVVIIGGLKRIARTAESIVPTMVFIYVAACLWIVITNFAAVPDAFGKIFSGAFSLDAGIGGLVGVLIIGFQRAAFSNEAGIGSAAIAHSAAKTPYPVREGMVALIEPFIDTVVICTMTALVIIITSHYGSAEGLSPELAKMIDAKQGAKVTASAFGSQISWFPYVLTICVLLFAYSTMISWSYYGERCWSYMFGEKTSIIYKMIFLGFVVLGSMVTSSNILSFTDVLFFAMALPNMIGLYFLQGKIAKGLKDYMAKLKSGEFDREAGNGQ